MTGLIEGIVFSKYTTFDVFVIEDYNIKGTFHPDAASDIEYYGYRDTDFYIVKAWGTDAVGSYEMTEDEIQNLIDNNKDKILLMVQDEIDKRSK